MFVMINLNAQYKIKNSLGPSGNIYGIIFLFCMNRWLIFKNTRVMMSLTLYVSIVQNE